ncbi:MAG TPA: hypothetical protein VK977_07145 [Actinomycetota bacterium]|nr:hypothetical protein [Actinomycetota bacterium]
MVAGRAGEIESIERLEERRAELLVREEEEGDAALDSLIDQWVEQEPPGREPEAEEPQEREFTCRGCHLIYSRACLANEREMLCADCEALAEAGGEPGGEVPHVHRIHHPCPACGALLMVPDREEVSCGFVCPSCRVHLMRRKGHLHLVWNHREAVIDEGIER